MNQLSQDDLQQFYNVLKKNGRLRNTERCGKELSDRTVRGCHITCRTALDKAVKDRLIRLNPAEGCKPPSVKKKEMQVLRIYKTKVNSKWMFPSPRKEDSPLDPASVRKQLCKTLERAGCKKLRFHDLRHTFATTALEYGMDVKTLSTVIGHNSVSTTLNIYAHITDDMRAAAAVKIDRGIAKQERAKSPAKKAASEKTETEFVAAKGQRRKAGTGCLSQIGEHLWEGKYSPRGPDGKKRHGNVYAHTREEKLKVLIQEMKAEIAAERKQRIKAA